MSGGYCGIHGSYFGLMCPSCGRAAPATYDPMAVNTVALIRVATALERIATAMERERA